MLSYRHSTGHVKGATGVNLDGHITEPSLPEILLIRQHQEPQEKTMDNGKFPQVPGVISTFSIVASDPDAGQVGVAVQSRYFAVGAVVPWVRAGVGAVATQALNRARYGLELLAALEKGVHPEEAIRAAIASDPRAEERQIGLVTANGEAACHTGAQCLEWAGGRTGPNFSVQGNILAGEEVVEHMVSAFLDTSGRLAERLLASLEAGQEAGGDRRGQQSAALAVEQTGYGDTAISGIDRLVDLRVDDHPAPIAELRRLYGLWQKHDLIEKVYVPYQEGNYQAAAELMRKANSSFPGDATILYNLACFESLLGQAAESLAHLRQAIALQDSFRESAAADSDFDQLRSLEEFKDLLEP
jgi:uncharacterized Ntn-hydrolase superfamily protein